MPTTTRTIRVFISSTFSDLKAERNALQQRVFPRLKRYCQRRGWSFQAIDLRWGISNEAALDQSTMRICRAEIARCQTVTPRPNFVVLLGDRHGWRPLPDEIPAVEFDALLPHLPSELANRWYRLDENAVCPLPDGAGLDKGLYVLQPRTGNFEDYDKWFDEVEGPLGDAFRRAARELGLTEDARLKYEASATAQEIHDGAFAVPDAREHVVAFIREIRTADGRPLRESLPGDAALKDFVDLKRGELDRESQAQLDALKQKLHAKLGRDRIKTYPARWEGNSASSEHVHRLSLDVLRSLGRLIHTQIKQHSVLPPLEEEQLRHQEFAQRRARDFTGQTVPLGEIERYLAPTSEPARPLVVHGASGSGKSALLAKAIQERQTEEGGLQKGKVIARFIGATANSTDLRSLLEGLCRELGEYYSADDAKLPLDLNKLTVVFRQRLELATAEQPLTLFVDALDQLQMSEGPDLSWLPGKLPTHVRLVVSAIAGPTLDALKLHLPSAMFLELGPMPGVEAEELLQKWLQRVGRRLACEEQGKAIREAFARCSLPLYLRLAFEEAQRWRSYDEPPPPSADVDGLIERLFNRLSEPANHGPLLVERAVSYLRCSRHGLSEDETLDLLAKDDGYWDNFQQSAHHALPLTDGQQIRRLPVVIWSRLYHDLEPYLSWRSSDGTALMVFFHTRFNEVADRHFLGDDNVRRARHDGLANYFATRPVAARKLDELPWQLGQARLWERLFELVRDLDTFDALWHHNPFDLKRYWTQMETHSDFRLAKAYYLPSNPASITAARAATWVRIARLLYDTDHVAEASVRIEAVVEVVRRAGVLPELQAALGVLGLCRAGQGYADQALDAFTERERICRQLGDLHGLQESLAPQGLLQVNKGDFDAAKRIYAEHESLCRRIGDLDGLQVSLGDQIILYSKLQDQERILRLEAEEESLCRSIGHRDGLARSLMNKSSRLLHQGQLPEAKAAATEAEKLHRELGNHTYRLIDLKHLGDIDHALDQPRDAVFHYAEGERLARRFGKTEQCAEFLVDEGRCHAALGHLGAALKLLQQAADLYGSLGQRRTKVGVLELMLQVHRVAEEVVPTIETLADLEGEYRELGEKARLARCLYQQAAFYLTEDAYKPERSLQLLTEAATICHAQNSPDLLPEIEKLLVEARKRAPTPRASSPLERDRDLKGLKIRDFRVQSAATDKDGNHVLGTWDEIRQRRFLIRIGAHNPVWTRERVVLDRLGNLREQADRIQEIFRSRLAAGQAIGDPRAADRTDILMVSKSGRLVLLNEPHWPEHALRVEDLDARAARENIPFSTKTVRGAFGMLFRAMIAAGFGGQEVGGFTEEDLPLLADKAFLTEIGEWIKRLDRRNNAGGYAEALDRVITGVSVMTLTGGYPPIQQNILILLMGLGESGQLSVQQFRETLVSKEFVYNLAPSYIQQVEAMARWIARVDPPAEVVRNYRWLCNQAWQLYRGGCAPEQGPAVAKVLNPPEPAAFEEDALCVETELN